MIWSRWMVGTSGIIARIWKVTLAMAIVTGFTSVFGIGRAVQAETLTVGAAPTLRTAFEEIMPLFEREHGATVHLVYGPSQTLRRQIENGAQIDVFLPSAAEEVEKLEEKGMTLNGGLRVYAQTSLVLVKSSASVAMSVSFQDVLPNPATRIALGDPRKSALGEVTHRALAKLAPGYRTHSRLLYAQHSEDVLNLVHTGKADVGIVYRVDAINSGKVRIIDEAPAGTHTPIRFGEAMVWTCLNESRGVAEEFLDFMMSPRIQKLLHKYGFDPALPKGLQGSALKP